MRVKDSKLSWMWIGIRDRIVLLGNIGERLQLPREEWRPVSLASWPESLVRR